jgi:VWFA-related protein
MGALLRVAAVLLVVSPALAQETPSRLPPAETGTVLVDVIVRDGKGRPVTDLTAADFQVLEDGVPQAIAQFSAPPSLTTMASVEATPATAPAPAANTAAPAAAPRGSGTLIAYVFDRLSTEGRVAAQAAVRAAVDRQGPGDGAGVFSVESTLVVLEDFTTDKTRLLAAVDAIGTHAAQSGPSQYEQAKSATDGRIAAKNAQALLFEMGKPRSAEQGRVRALAQMEATRLSLAQAAEDAFARLARDEAGQTTSHALAAIVDALRDVPGRKAIVLFSEGLFRTEANELRFRSVVHAANRASVSVYAIEAQGLQAKSYESLTAAEVRSTSLMSMARTSGADEGGGTFLRDLETVEDSVRFHPRASLEWISAATGGVFVRDTNDIAGAVERIASDSRSYYLLGYTPQNAAFDGRYRKIQVKVSRKDVDVKARDGYFAVRSLGPVLAHVAPALAILERGQRPHAIPLHAGAWAFPSGTGLARVPVSVSVPGDALAPLAKAAKRKRVDLTLLARVVDSDGRAVEAMSRRFAIDAAKAGDVVLLRDAWLPAGRYTLEAVAYEPTTSRAGVATAEIEVLEGRRALERPQVLLVRSAVPAAHAPDPLESGHPLAFGDVVLEPLAGEPIDRSPTRPIIFQVAAATADGLSEVGARLEVWRGERKILDEPLAWIPPRASGLFRHVAELPIDRQPGRYELRVRLAEKGEERVLRAPFEIAGKD